MLIRLQKSDRNCFSDNCQRPIREVNQIHNLTPIQKSNERN